MYKTDLQRHQQTLTFYIREAQIYTARIPIRITIPHNMLHLIVDSFDQPVRKFLDSNMVSLSSLFSGLRIGTAEENFEKYSVPLHSSHYRAEKGPQWFLQSPGSYVLSSAYIIMTIRQIEYSHSFLSALFGQLLPSQQPMQWATSHCVVRVLDHHH